MPKKKVLITGARAWTNLEKIRSRLSGHDPETTLIIVGRAKRGADLIAEQIADEYGFEVDPHPVTDEEWRIHGYRAGHLRNQEMVDLEPDLCHAFCVRDDGGTKDCINRVRWKGIPLTIDWEDEE